MWVKDKKQRKNYVHKNPELKSDLGYISLVCVCVCVCVCVVSSVVVCTVGEMGEQSPNT